ncbi:uncharacterized protein LOC108742041 [Agrilus planipennis]|uniref:Uncharacterized protein LOC108742041 n=1 Tax=Agrilus planipennis TaxID=224129 RepID=A0A1W4X8W3_AGRPL|nr:uncharacterized protein LOC108742041 [Agrilus planipennis]
MKLPFYTVFGPSIRRNYRTLKTVCSYRFLNTSVIYAGFLGFIGLILSLFDVVRIIKAGPVLPCVMWRARIRTGSVVSPECERDFRLMSLVFSLEYYFLLIIGTATSKLKKGRHIPIYENLATKVCCGRLG